MLSFLNLNNPDTAIVKFVQLAGIAIDPKQITAELDKHPDYPSLLAISDVLNNFQIKNSALRLEFEELSTLPTPFIAHTNENGGDFVVVSKIGNNAFWVSNQKWNKRKIEAKDFRKRYSGVALIAEPGNVRAGILVPQNRLAAASLLLILCGLLAFHSTYFSVLSWQHIWLSLVKTAGLSTSILLLIQSIDENNPLVMKICEGGRKTSDCKAILASPAAKAFDWLSWSEVGFFYFGGTWLLALFGSGSILIWKVLFLLNLISLPYTFWSIWHQATIAKQWCVLCCTIQALLWLEFIPLASINLSFPLQIRINAADISTILICLFSPVILWMMLKPMLLNLQQLGPLKDQLRKFKYNNELFNKLLQEQPNYALPAVNYSLVLGNKEAANTITMVSNPYCGPCAKTHQMVDELLETNSSIQVLIVFTADNTDNDIKTPVCRHLMALNELQDEDLLRRAMHDWYEEKQKDYDAWAKQYPVELNQANFYKLDEQRTWCNVAEIKATPTLLLNGYMLPAQYRLTDLKYMLQ